MNRYRIDQIKLRPGEPETVIPDKLKKAAGRSVRINDWEIVRRSVDARNKNDIKVVYSVEFSSSVEARGLNAAKSRKYELPYDENLNFSESVKRPVIVGFGPCGMFCGLVLSQLGLSPIIIERGQPVQRRVKDVNAFMKSGVLDPESNIQFGEGGAGTFSDGKLTTGITDPRIWKVLREFADAGAGEDILVNASPHIGTDVLRRVVINIRKKIIENHGDILFGEKLEKLDIEDGKIRAVETSSGIKAETDDVVLAIGHSARDTYDMLYKTGIRMIQKPFSIGLRIEHPQRMINAAQYGDPELAGILGPAAYKLSHHCNDGRGVYTFCMCPGGEVIVASSEEGYVVTNGMSFRARDGAYANSALLVDVRTTDLGSDDPLAGIRFQRKYEKLAFLSGGSDYSAPKTRYADLRGSKAAGCLPVFAVSSILEAMPHLGRRLRGFDSGSALMTAVESRSSAPVRILRDGNMMCGVKGLYPCGEGAGYAGGIVSAAVDGIKAAEMIAGRYAKKGTQLK